MAGQGGVFNFLKLGSSCGKRAPPPRSTRAPKKTSREVVQCPAIMAVAQVERRGIAMVEAAFRREWDARAIALTRNPAIYGIGARFFVLEYCLTISGVLRSPPIPLMGIDAQHFVDEIRKHKVPKSYAAGKSKKPESERLLKLCRLEADGRVRQKSMTMGEARSTLFDLLNQLWVELRRAMRLAAQMTEDVIKYTPMEGIIRNGTAEIGCPTDARAMYVLRTEEVISHLRIAITAPTLVHVDRIQVELQPAWGDTLAYWRAHHWQPTQWVAYGDQANYAFGSNPPLSEKLVVGLWNVRGANCESFEANARDFIKIYGIKILILTETRVGLELANFLVGRTGMNRGMATEGFATHGGTWVLWDRAYVEGMELVRGEREVHALVGVKRSVHGRT